MPRPNGRHVRVLAVGYIRPPFKTIYMRIDAETTGMENVMPDELTAMPPREPSQDERDKLRFEDPDGLFGFQR